MTPNDAPLVIATQDGVATVTMQFGRANALTPAVLGSLNAALDDLSTQSLAGLILTAGRNFCSGGDVEAFYHATQTNVGRSYAAQVVPALNNLINRMITLPFPVVVAASGAITGGGAGILFAADMAVLSPDCFVQPYYAQMGFAPDGGWTALLPALIGMGPARSWLLSDHRKTADQLVSLGLASQVSADPVATARSLLRQDPATLCAAKSLLWPEEKREELRRLLQAEAEAFFDLIDRPETANRMEKFLFKEE